MSSIVDNLNRSSASTRKALLGRVAIQPWHHEMDYSFWPLNLKNTCWAKCDVILTVADWRLDRYFQKDQYGKRKYQAFRATTADFAAIKTAVATALTALT